MTEEFRPISATIWNDETGEKLADVQAADSGGFAVTWDAKGNMGLELPPEPYGPCPHLPHDHCLRCGPGTIDQIAERNKAR